MLTCILQNGTCTFQSVINFLCSLSFTSSFMHAVTKTSCLDLLRTYLSTTCVASFLRVFFFSSLVEKLGSGKFVNSGVSYISSMPSSNSPAVTNLASTSSEKNLRQACTLPSTSALTFLRFIKFLPLYNVHLSIDDEVLYSFENATIITFLSYPI